MPISTGKPKLSIILPTRSVGDELCQQFLQGLRFQTFQDFEVCLEEGPEPEQQKAVAIQRAQGDLLGFFCTDNVLRDPRFLEIMVRYADDPTVTGAYPYQYDYVPTDTMLSRYFALLGDNDPVCWWLGKADRNGWTRTPPPSFLVRFTTTIPSLGDNGYFVKAHLLRQTVFTPETFGSCMDSADRLRQLGHATYWMVSDVSVWHQTGRDFWDYIRRRARYVRRLYFQRLHLRQWRMVASRRDWILVLGFALASCLVVPQVWIALAGARRVRDRAWILHPVVCGLLTLVYTWECLRHYGHQWLSQHGSGQSNSGGVSMRSGHKPSRSSKPLSMMMSPP